MTTKLSVRSADSVERQIGLYIRMMQVYCAWQVRIQNSFGLSIKQIKAKECLSHMLRRACGAFGVLPPFRPVLNADARNYSVAQAQSQHPVKWDECDVKKYIYIKRPKCKRPGANGANLYIFIYINNIIIYLIEL